MVTATPIIAMGENVSPNIKNAPNDANIGADDCIRTDLRGPIVTYAANSPKSPIPSPTTPLKPIQNHCPLLARGTSVPSRTTWAHPRNPMAIIVRYALTLKEPNLLPADVNKRELNVQKHEVRIAADSPTMFESKFLTFRLDQDDQYDLKPFPRMMHITFGTRMNKNKALDN